MDVTRTKSNLTEQPKHFGQQLVVWIVCLSMTACVSHQAVESKHEKIAAELEPGDRVEIVLRDGQEISFRIKEIRETELIGDTRTQVSAGKIVTVPYEDITRLERVDQKPLVVLSIVAVPVIVIGLLFLALGVYGGGAVMM